VTWTEKDPLIKPERKGGIIATEGERGGRELRSLAAPLEFYVARRYITGKQYEAGTRLHALWRGSIISARFATMKFGDRKGDYDPESMALMPRDYFRAMDAVQGFHAKRMVRMVCCFEEIAGGSLGMRNLKSGLDDLIKHFRY
jgi:hypothetical protein